MALSLATEAAGAGTYPSTRLGQRERKILESVKTYVDAQILSAVAAPEASSIRTAADAAAIAALDASGAIGDVIVAIDTGVLYVHDGTNFSAVTMA